MKKNIAINGFGRIGRNFLRTVLSDPDATKVLNIVALNTGPAPKSSLDYLFTYDSTMGTYPGSVSVQDGYLHVDGHKIKIVSELDPRALPWKQLNIDWVVEASGKYTERKEAQKHREAGACGVLITAPSADADVSLVLGVNDSAFKKGRDSIVSLGSCTTNALVPLLDSIDKKFGLSEALFTTIHSYTNNQSLVDADSHDPRRARAAALNIIPTTTGATEVVDQVLPSLKGKVSGCSVRVPVATVSLIDLVFIVKKDISVGILNELFNSVQTEQLRGILSYTTVPLVSSDVRQKPFSVVVDGLLTDSVGRMGKVFGWYDNEWGYSCRLKDFLVMYG